MRLIKNYIIGPLTGLAFMIGFSLNSVAHSELIVFDWGGYEDSGFFKVTLKNTVIVQLIHSFQMKRKHFKK